MPELYAQAFDLKPKAAVDPMAAMSLALREWTTGRWPQGNEWFSSDEHRALRAPDGSIFRWEPFADGTRRLLEFTWRHAHSTDPRIQWTTRVVFGVLPHRIYCSIRVANTGPELGRPGALPTTRPRLLLSLAQQFALSTRGMTAQLNPIELREKDFPSFVRYELFDPERRYPVLLLSPTATDEYVVSPAAVGREFIGIAKTYVAASAASTYALTEELGGRELSCFHGAMRVYMPGLAKGAPIGRHPLVLPRRLSTAAERLRVAQALTWLTTATFSEEPFVSELRDERAVAYDDRRRTLLAQLSNSQSAASDGADYQRLAELYAEQNSQLLREVEQLREELEEARHKSDALQYSLGQLQQSRADDASVEGAPLLPPSDVADAVEQAEALFEDDLFVLPSAHESAAASPYRNASEVAAALRAVAEVAERMRAGPLGKSLKDAFAELGMDYGGGLSASTPKKLRKQYVFPHEGTEYVCEEHLRVGGSSHDPADCLRIYFNSKARPKGRIVIGHVGRHLDVISTN